MNFNGLPAPPPGTMIAPNGALLTEDGSEIMLPPQHMPPFLDRYGTMYAQPPHMGGPGGHPDPALAMHHMHGPGPGPMGMHMPPSMGAQGPPPMPDMPGFEGEIMDAEFAKISRTMVDGADRGFGCSAVRFDTEQELVWVGNTTGHVTSYHTSGQYKYTAFQVYMGQQPVREIVTCGPQVLTLMPNTLKCNKKLGPSIFNITNELYKDLQCMILSSPTTLVFGGHQSEMFEMDLTTQQHIRQIDIGDPGSAIMRYSSQFLCTGDTSGKIHLRAPDTLQTVHTLDSHSGTLSDFDVHGNRLISCGFCLNSRGDLAIERFIKVYDFRMMRAVNPIQVPLDPIFLRFIPTFSERICVVGERGQFQILEQGTNNPTNMIMYDANTGGAVVNAFDISSTNQAISFADASGFMHLFASSPEAQFNAYSEETEFPNPEPPPASIDINDDLASLSVIPMHYPTEGQLLSDWPPHMLVREYRSPQKLDQNLLNSAKDAGGNVAYVPNPGTQRRNQVPYKLDNNPRTRNRQSSVPESPLAKVGDNQFVSIPKRYRKIEIKYSKLGIEDFDFRHYNKTNFAGLENHIPNAYCNSMLQVLYFIEPLRTSMLSHLCEKEFCLTCEMGFLCHMLDEQKGKTCQATNFLRAFRTIPEVTALGLLLSEADEAAGKMKLTRLVQSLNRFLLQQIHSEFSEASKYRLYRTFDVLQKELAEMTNEPDDADNAANSNDDSKNQSPISRIFYTSVDVKFRCRCNLETTKNSQYTVFDLNYPDITPQTGKDIRQDYSFSEVAVRSMCNDTHTQAWCNQCGKYQNHLQSRELKNLPDMLVFNCRLENPRDIAFWRTQEAIVSQRVKKYKSSQEVYRQQTMNVKMCRYGDSCKRADCKFKHSNDDERHARNPPAEMPFNLDEHDDPNWIPLGMGIELKEDGTVTMVDLEDENDPAPSGTIAYDLFAVVSHIKDEKTGGNLTSCVKVDETFHQRKEKVTCTQWYLFNDFSVTPIEKYESTYVHMDWKVPCVIYFKRRDLNSHHDRTITNNITPDVLFREAVLVTPRRKNITFIPLEDTELPTDNTIIGLDTEFVTLNQEEAELRSDGTQSLIKPSQVSVARVTCIRGDGAMQGEPFIDDYISTQEQVVDYMTQFSGIKPGDLDVHISSKHLTTLKSTYLKLRYLLDNGCKFVGHGLKKDFRVINLPWPKDKIIDTVDLFRLPRQRMISLKFLAWYFLDLKIQTKMHDSTEDARTALNLYKKYQALKAEGGDDHVKKTLMDLYDEGRKLKWKVPEVEEGENEDMDYGLFPTS